MIVDTKDIQVKATTTLRDALERLNASSIKIILVTDKDNHLVGTCTDGDFRRAMLKSGNIDGFALDIANRNPVTVHEDLNAGKLKSLIRERNVRYIPIIDDQGRLKGLYDGTSKPKSDDLKVPIVLMAGGLGRRLMPLTRDCPKPLLPLAGETDFGTHHHTVPRSRL